MGNTAVVLVGGQGTRLSPLSTELAKPAMPLFDRTVLEWVLTDLFDVPKLDRVILASGYKGEQFVDLQASLAKRFGSRTRVEVSTEPEPMGTAGALGRLAPSLEGDILILNGDSRLETDLGSFLNGHRQSRMPITIAAVQVPETQAFGSLLLKKDRVLGFHEKSEQPRGEGWINGGIYCIEAEVLKRLPRDRAASLEADYFPRWVDKPGIVAYGRTGYFQDLGTPGSYLQYARDLLCGRADGLVDDDVEGADLRWSGQRTEVSDEAQLEGTVVLGNDCKVGHGAYLKDCVLWDGCHVAPGAVLSECILGRGVQVPADAHWKRLMRVGSGLEGQWQ